MGEKIDAVLGGIVIIFLLMSAIFVFNFIFNTNSNSESDSHNNLYICLDGCKFYDNVIPYGKIGYFDYCANDCNDKYIKGD